MLHIIISSIYNFSSMALSNFYLNYVKILVEELG